MCIGGMAVTCPARKAAYPSQRRGQVLAHDTHRNHDDHVSQGFWPCLQGMNCLTVRETLACHAFHVPHTKAASFSAGYTSSIFSLPPPPLLDMLSPDPANLGLPGHLWRVGSIPCTANLPASWTDVLHSFQPQLQIQGKYCTSGVVRALA